MQLFFELIQVSIGTRDILSRVPTEEEWEEAYELARKQAVAGVTFMGVLSYVEKQHKKCRMQKLQFDGVNAGCRNVEHGTLNLEPESSDDEEEFDESWLEAVNLPEELYYTWMQQAMDIQKRNRLMDERCVELQKMLSDAGFRSCILKGQGVAKMYAFQASHQITDDRLQITESKQSSLETKTEKTPIDSFDSVNLNDEVCISQNLNEFSPCENQSPSTSLAVENESIGNKQEINNANDNNINGNDNANDNLELGTWNLELASLRQSGDIDVWVFGGQEKVLSYITNTGNNGNWDYSHVEYNCFDDAAVEVHYRPSSVPNLFLNRKLQAFYSSYEKVGNMNDTHLESGIISTPTNDFNFVYLLLHIYRHFIGGGIGLRQVMDYYFVLRTVEKVESVEKVKKVIKELGLEKFAAAMLWVIAKVFANEDELLSLKGSKGEEMNSWMLWKPNEKEGKFLLEEIMRGGNFGKYDNRFKSGRKHSKINTIKKNLTHTFNIISHYPNECFWIPIWIVWHWCWKRYFSLRSKRLKD